MSLNQLVAEFSFCTPSAPPSTYAFKQYVQLTAVVLNGQLRVEPTSLELTLLLITMSWNWPRFSRTTLWSSASH